MTDLKLKKGSRVGIVCCSKGRPRDSRGKQAMLERALRELGSLTTIHMSSCREMS